MIDRRRFIPAGLMALGSLTLGSLGLMGFTRQTGQKAAGVAQCADRELCAERKAQQALPQSGDPLWATLRACKVGYNDKTGLYSLQPTAQVRAMVGQVVRIRGFTLPLDGTDKTAHFLIGINTPVCFYHPPGDPNEVIEVVTERPITWSEKPTTVEGAFSLIDNGEMGVFFKMIKARQV